MSKTSNKHSDARHKARTRRRVQIRKNLRGTTERPRLCVFRSSRHIYAQVVDDSKGTTVAAVSTLTAEVRALGAELDGRGRSKLVGEAIAKKCKDLKIESIVFDRGGFLYKGGRVKALAKAARDAGLTF